MTHHQPTDHTARIPVHPRYLAGTTMEGYADILDALVGTHGWSGADDPYANYYATSPCHRFRLGFMPELWPEPIVQVTAATAPMRSPLWHIAFDQHTPQELIAAVTEDLADAIRDHAALTPRHFHPGAHSTVAPLASEWSTWSGAGNTMHLAPDALASLVIHRPSDPGVPAEQQMTWSFRGGITTHAWHADFSYHTPDRLIRAFHQAVTSSAPLLRQPDDIPTVHLPHIGGEHHDHLRRQGAAQQRSVMEPPPAPARTPAPATAPQGLGQYPRHHP